MKKVIVSTTINPPTEAIEAFQAMRDWELVVIGDKKTPRDYRLSRGIYVTAEETEKYDPALSEAVGSELAKPWARLVHDRRERVVTFAVAAAMRFR